MNRAYYACFYAVSALLLAEGHSSPKHSGVRALFDQHWIVSGRLPKSMGRFYRQLFDSRQKGDYADLVTFDRADVNAWVHKAAKFVEQVAGSVEGFLTRLGASHLTHPLQRREDRFTVRIEGGVVKVDTRNRIQRQRFERSQVTYL